jgi:hypothetical protein
VHNVNAFVLIKHKEWAEGRSQLLFQVIGEAVIIIVRITHVTHPIVIHVNLIRVKHRRTVI